MFCIHCGAPNPEGASFCSSCGKKIDALSTPSSAVEAPRVTAPLPGLGGSSSGNVTAQNPSPMTLQAQPAPQPAPQYPPASTGKGKPVLWVLAGFAACLLIVIAVALGSRLSGNRSGSGPATENITPDVAPTTAPTADTAPAATPTADPAPAPTADTPSAPAADTAPAPAHANAPVQVAPQPVPAAVQNPIVGDWKATTFIGSTIGLHLGADGRYVLNPGSDEGVYSYSSGDGTLRLQSSSFFSKGIMVWSCQVSGDSLSCVDPNGAGHVYSRIR